MAHLVRYNKATESDVARTSGLQPAANETRQRFLLTGRDGTGSCRFCTWEEDVATAITICGI